MLNKGRIVIAFAVLLLAIYLQPRKFVLLIDCLLYIFSKLDGIEKHNQQKPNYVDGNWQPIHEEKHRVPVKGQGKLPVSFTGGMYVRSGANPSCWPPGGSFINHAFNGYAMLHRIEIINSEEIAYSNSWIRGEHMDMESWKPMQECPYKISYGDIVNNGYFKLPKILFLKLKLKLLGIKEPFREKQYPGSTSVVQHAHRTLACTEVFLPYEIRIKRNSIESIGFTDLDGLLVQNKPEGPQFDIFSAHPKIDPETGELYFFSIGPHGLPQLFFGSLNSNGTPGTSFHIPLDSPTTFLFHDMLLTKNYVIVPDHSMRADYSRILFGKGITYFDRSKMLRFAVIPRANLSLENVKWISTKSPGYVYHTVSAWENIDETITAFMPKFDAYNDNIDIHLSTEQPSYLTKFTLNLKTGLATEERILDLVVERPSYNTGILSPTIVYLRAEGENSREMGTELIKYDLKNEKILGKFKCHKECVFGEALFVPSSGKMLNQTLESKEIYEEGNGHLMDIVYHPKTNSSSFIVINAKTMSSEPTFISKLPQRVPYGVHGIWLENEYFED